MKEMPQAAELNDPFPDSHHNSAGVKIFHLYRQNFKTHLEIKLLLISARDKGLYVSRSCIKLS